MNVTDRPCLRRVESFPVHERGGEVVFALRDPEGFSGAIVVPHAAAVAASLMDGTRTIDEICQTFQQQTGQPADAEDIQQLVGELDQRYLLDTPRFRARWKVEIERYLNNPVRPAAHAGGAYAAEPEALRSQLAGLFTGEKGPGAPGEPTATVNGERLCGVLSPHIDLHRGGPAFAWAYKRIIEESQADLFVIFGTAHSVMRSLFSVTRKGYETPLGTMETDRQFVSKLASKLASLPAGREMNLFADELAHRQEHSIEFQVLFLQHLLGQRRPVKIVPVLCGSFHEFVATGASPAASPEVAAFVTAMRQTANGYAGRICFISGGDLAHIGRRFGDPALLDAARLQQQAADDQRLLAAACQPDAEAFFQHVARERDCHRICGLSPTYTMLEVMRPKRGELLSYDQAVELDGSACVSFASLAFYGD